MDWLVIEWLILLLLVPAILVPIIILFGFVGCDFPDVTFATVPPAPTNLAVNAEGVAKIKLQWTHTDPTVTFQISRGTTPSSLTPIPVPPVSGLSFEDTTPGLVEGTTFFYEVTAINSAGPSPPSGLGWATTFPAAPSNLVATPTDVDKIELSWTSNSTTSQFIIQDTSGGALTEIKAPGPPMPFSHLVAPGSAHEYRVLAVIPIPAGFQNSVQQEVRSEPFPPNGVSGVTAKPLAFKTVLVDDQANLEGFCLVQRIASSQLKNSGTKVTITLRGSSAGQLTLDRVYISQPDPAPGKDRWDSLPPGSPGGLTKVVDNDPPVVLSPPDAADPNRNAKTLGPVAYGLDSSKDLLVAFDISAAPGQGNVRSVLLPGTGTEHYYRAATEPPGQAARADRSPAAGLPPPGFTTGADRLYLVEQIEVL